MILAKEIHPLNLIMKKRPSEFIQNREIKYNFENKICSLPITLITNEKLQPISLTPIIAPSFTMKILNKSILKNQSFDQNSISSFNNHELEANQNQNYKEIFHDWNTLGSSFQKYKPSHKEKEEIYLRSLELGKNFFESRFNNLDKEIPLKSPKNYFKNENINDQSANINQNKLEIEEEEKDIKKSTKCTCSKNHCLKQYCKCLNSGQYCKGCNCVNCFNNLENETLRKQNLEKRYKKDYCTCKKSECLKKYCECFFKGKLCSKKCQCFKCFNTFELQSKKRKLNDEDKKESIANITDNKN